MGQPKPGRRYTLDRISRDLRSLGVRSGQTLLVHSSLRAVGPTEDGATTVVAALQDVLGSPGTLVVPANTADNSDTSRIHRARTAEMSSAQLRQYRRAMKAFDPVTTPSTAMGSIAERVRTTPGAVRSEHPQTSFAALGFLARSLMSGHAANCHFGETSPLARLYDIGAWVMLLGVGYEACSAFHLAEYRYVKQPPTRTYRCVVMKRGKRCWWEYTDVDLDDRNIRAFGEYHDQAGTVISGRVANADCRLMPITSIVDIAIEWLRIHR
jgi:aminoglycoside 3-N-acetyltransferase